MFMLYSVLLAMFLSGLGLLTFPFIIHRSAISLRSYIGMVLLILTLSFGLYSVQDHQGLKRWLGGGREHYQLVESFYRLGGLEGVIARIEQRLVVDPDDSHGWLILGKLYLASHDCVKAKIALTKANQLQPDNAEIIQVVKTHLLKQCRTSQTS